MRGIGAYRHDRNDPASLSGHAVEAIAFTRDGSMWIRSNNGLNLFDPERGTARRVRGLPNEWVPDLMVDRRCRRGGAGADRERAAGDVPRV